MPFRDPFEGTLENIVATGRAGLIFVIPGRDTTLRVNGRAAVSAEPDLLERLTAVGKPPRTAIVVEAEEVYAHCLQFELHRSLERPEEVIAIERWASKEDHERHFQTEHIRSLIERTQPIMAAPPEMQVYEPLA